jgi:hypothetical protein
MITASASATLGTTINGQTVSLFVVANGLIGGSKEAGALFGGRGTSADEVIRSPSQHRACPPL